MKNIMIALSVLIISGALFGYNPDHLKRLNNCPGCDLSGANLNGAQLKKADLSEANLGGADLRGARLDNANLSFADLSNANLFFTELSGANLLGANLAGAANLDRIGYDEKTNFNGALLNKTKPDNVREDLQQAGAICLPKDCTKDVTYSTYNASKKTDGSCPDYQCICNDGKHVDWVEGSALKQKYFEDSNPGCRPEKTTPRPSYKQCFDLCDAQMKKEEAKKKQ